MIITTIQELRLHNPSHAYDSIDYLVGFIDNSEHDVLEEKLGTPLYNQLCKYYRDNSPVSNITTVVEEDTDPWNELLLMSQRVVAFDALGRAVGMQVISPNNSGINVATASDYDRPKKEDYDTYRDTCYQEAHAAINHLLRRLEQWCKEQPVLGGSAAGNAVSSPVPGGSAAGNPSALSPQPSDIEDERSEIVALWRQSRYFYLAASLLIPSCEVLQSYLNIYDSREKFIQLLPDLQFIQEEIIGNAIGDDLLQLVIAFSRDGKLPEATDSVPSGTVPSDSVAGEGTSAANSSLFTFNFSLLTEPTLTRLLHRLRKVMVALLVGRTNVLKYDKAQKIQAHDDGVRMLQNVTEYLKSLVPPEPASPVPGGSAAGNPQPSAVAPQPPCPVPGGSASDNAALWTPPLL